MNISSRLRTSERSQQSAGGALLEDLLPTLLPGVTTRVAATVALELILWLLGVAIFVLPVASTLLDRTPLPLARPFKFVSRFA